MFIGKFADRKGVRIPLVVGPIITSAGFFLFSTFGVTAGSEVFWETFFLSFLLIGVGMGITVAPLTTAVMGAVSEDNMGIASGINNTVARAAGVLAIALMGSLALFSFSEFIEKELGEMDISSGNKNEIMLESSKFAAAEVPASLSESKKIIVKKLIKDSFVGAFNKVVYVATVLTFLGSLMAYIFIKPKKPD